MLKRLQQQGLEVAEIRVDLAANQDAMAVRTLCQSFFSMPTILTVRSLPEGGQFAGSEEARRCCLLSALPYVDAVDVELAADFSNEVIARAHLLEKTCIVSYHNLTATDSIAAIGQYYMQATACGADVFKYAGWCTEAPSYQTLHAFAQRCRADGQPCIVIGMGDDDHYARVARQRLPGAGSCLAFAAIGAASAPGQLSLAQTVAACRQAV